MQAAFKAHRVNRSQASRLLAFLHGEASIGEGEGDATVRALKSRGLIENTAWRQEPGEYGYQHAQLTAKGRELARALAHAGVSDAGAAELLSARVVQGRPAPPTRRWREGLEKDRKRKP